MTLTIIISLLVAGLFFLILEILVLPGGIVGLLGIVMMSFAIYAGYAEHGEETGHYLLGITMASTGAAVYFSLKSRTWKKLMLEDTLDAKANTLEVEIIPGDEGITVGRIMPVGKAIIKDRYFEVQAYESYIEHDTPIVVYQVEGNKIIVKPKL